MAGRRWAAGALTASMVVWGVAALGGGYGMAGSPDGSAMNFQVDWLSHTPFPDWRVPGLLLMAVGVASWCAAYVLWRALRAAEPAASGRWRLVLVVAVGHLCWICGEIAFLWWPVSEADATVRRFFWAFWAVYLPWAVLEVWLTPRPSVRALFR